MKIQKQSITKKLITEQEYAATAQEEAEKINAQTNAGYVTDQAFWEERGIFTGEELALSVLAQTYSDLYKDIHGFRPRHGEYKSVEHYTHAINDLDEYYREIVLQDEFDLQQQKKYEKERAELAALMPGEFDFQDLPKQSGMGRRMENRMLRMAPQTLRQIIREAYKNHVDGHPFPGTLEDLAKLHGKPWGHGAVVDPAGWGKAVKLGGQFTKGTAPSPLKKNKMKLSERQLRTIVRASLSETGQLNIPLGGSGPGGEYAYGEFQSTPEVQNMLMDAGFNADGSFGADGYPGPENWQMYAPKNIEEAEGWIQAALDMNDSLRAAESALAAGKYQDGQSAYYELISPVQDKYSKHGAADTEGRNVAADWLEKEGFEWGY